MLKRTLKSSLLVVLLSTAVAANVEAMTSYGPVKRGETLWTIAKKTHPKHVSVANMMQAIEKLNPKAFDNLNTGVLRVGSKLEVPTTVAEVKQALNQAAATTTQSAASTAAATPSASAATSTDTAASTSVSTSATDDAATNGTPTVPVTPKYNKMNKPQLLAAIGQLQQQVQSAQQTQAAAQEQAQQVQQQLDQAQQKMIQLEQNVSQLQDQVSSFPWSWLWFVLFALCGGTYIWRTGRLAKIRAKSEGENPSDPKSVNLEEVATSDEGNGSIMANVMIAMAEGDYNAAKGLLISGIRKDHDSLELRMKLLEVYAQLNDRNAFNAESEYMLKHGLVHEHDDNWKIVRTMYLKKWVYDN